MIFFICWNIHKCQLLRFVCRNANLIGGNFQNCLTVCFVFSIKFDFLNKTDWSAHIEVSINNLAFVEHHSLIIVWEAFFTSETSRTEKARKFNFPTSSAFQWKYPKLVNWNFLPLNDNTLLFSNEQVLFSAIDFFLTVSVKLQFHEWNHLFWGKHQIGLKHFVSWRHFPS